MHQRCIKREDSTPMLHHKVNLALKYSASVHPSERDASKPTLASRAHDDAQTGPVDTTLFVDHCTAAQYTWKNIKWTRRCPKWTSISQGCGHAHSSLCTVHHSPKSSWGCGHALWVDHCTLHLCMWHIVYCTVHTVQVHGPSIGIGVIVVIGRTKQHWQVWMQSEGEFWLQLGICRI